METLELTPAESVTVPSAPDPMLSTAEIADCNCPDFCERDHDND